MAAENILICLMCKEKINIDDARMPNWLKTHMRHKVIVDYITDWYDKWKNDTSRTGGESPSKV